MLKDVEINLPVKSDGSLDTDIQNQLEEKIIFLEEIKQKVEDYKQKINELNIEIKDNEQKNKLVKIDDIFDIKKGQSKYTNFYIQKNKGNFDLYSSQTTNKGVIGKINSFDFDKQCLTWTTDGIHAGTVFLRNEKFSMTTHCGALILKNDIKNISLDFIYSFLKENLKKYAVGEQNKRITVSIIKNIEIQIPINKNGDYDLQTQKEIAEKYKKIEDIKIAINIELDKISEIEVDL